MPSSRQDKATTGVDVAANADVVVVGLIDGIGVVVEVGLIVVDGVVGDIGDRDWCRVVVEDRERGGVVCKRAVVSLEERVIENASSGSTRVSSMD